MFINLSTVIHAYNLSTPGVEWRQKDQEVKIVLGYAVQDQLGLRETLSQKERKESIHVS